MIRQQTPLSNKGGANGQTRRRATYRGKTHKRGRGRAVENGQLFVGKRESRDDHRAERDKQEDDDRESDRS